MRSGRRALRQLRTFPEALSLSVRTSLREEEAVSVEVSLTRGYKATLGARLFAPLEPSSIGMVFNAGGDFPSAVIEIFRSWFTSLQVHHYSDKPSARGLVFYEKANGNSTTTRHPYIGSRANGL